MHSLQFRRGQGHPKYLVKHGGSNLNWILPNGVLVAEQLTNTVFTHVYSTKTERESLLRAIKNESPDYTNKTQFKGITIKNLFGPYD